MAAPSQGRQVPPTDAKRRALSVSLMDRATPRADRHERIRLWGSLLTLALGAAVFVVLFMLPGGAGLASVSPGPVARVHASFENDCGACHASAEPIRADAFGAPPPPTRKWGRASDERCRACHAVASLGDPDPRGGLAAAGPAITEHSMVHEIPELVASCGSCHAEHRGRDADLNRLPDRFCVDCHADLATHRQPARDPMPPPPESEP
jgi:predicted CXXCH cytochrome family protein